MVCVVTEGFNHSSSENTIIKLLHSFIGTNLIEVCSNSIIFQIMTRCINKICL